MGESNGSIAAGSALDPCFCPRRCRFMSILGVYKPGLVAEVFARSIESRSAVLLALRSSGRSLPYIHIPCGVCSLSLRCNGSYGGCADMGIGRPLGFVIPPLSCCVPSESPVVHFLQSLSAVYPLCSPQAVLTSCACFQRRCTRPRQAGSSYTVLRAQRRCIVPCGSYSIGRLSKLSS